MKTSAGIDLTPLAELNAEEFWLAIALQYWAKSRTTHGAIRERMELSSWACLLWWAEKKR